MPLPPKYNKKGSYYTGPKRPGRKTEKRLEMPKIPIRPLRFQVRSIIRQELIGKDPYWMVIHRRGISRPQLGGDPREARAIPHDLLRGTLPERIIYKALVEEYDLVSGSDFIFQSCVEKTHKVLTADLRWVEVGTLQVGDELLSFTEHGEPRRKWTKGKVTANSIESLPSYKVKLSNGKEIITTPNHPWLVHYSIEKHDWGKATGYSWVETQNLKIGGYIPIFMDEWETDDSYEAGWVSGFFDGEGAVIHGKTQTGGHSLSLTVSQNKSLMLNRFNEYVEQLGFEFTNYDYSGMYNRSYDMGKREVVHCRLAGGRAECFRFLGSIRPCKLTYLKIDKLGKLTKIRQVRIISVEPCGNRDIARLEVDKHTYIIEGFGMHNSLQGGRIDTGGIVADFLFPYMMMVINPLGPTHFGLGETHFDSMQMLKDDEQIMALEEMGYTVHMVSEKIIYDQDAFNNWMRRIFIGQGQVAPVIIDGVVSNNGFTLRNIGNQLSDLSSFITSGQY